MGGWGAVSLFPLVACMLHVGGYLCDDIAMIWFDDPFFYFDFDFSDDFFLFIATGCCDRFWDSSLGPMLLLTMSFFVHRGCVVYSHSGLYC